MLRRYPRGKTLPFCAGTGQRSRRGIPVNKNELVDYIAEKSKSDLSKALITEIIELAFQGIEQELKNGGEARFVGFGTFKLARRKATTGRNPRTGENIKIAASNRVKFTAGKELKEAVNQ